MRKSLDQLNAQPEIDSAGIVGNPYPGNGHRTLSIVLANDSPDNPISATRAAELTTLVKAVEAENDLQPSDIYLPFVRPDD